MVLFDICDSVFVLIQKNENLTHIVEYISPAEMLIFTRATLC